MTPGRGPRLPFAGVFFLALFVAAATTTTRAEGQSQAVKPAAKPKVAKAKPKSKSRARETAVRQPSWGTMPPAKPMAFKTWPRPSLTPAQALERHEEGLAAERAGDDFAALRAFQDAADAGHVPAQLKLGEIYDRGNAAADRDYATALGWYQKAREQGMAVPKPHTFPAGR